MPIVVSLVHSLLHSALLEQVWASVEPPGFWDGQAGPGLPPPKPPKKPIPPPGAPGSGGGGGDQLGAEDPEDDGALPFDDPAQEVEILRQENAQLRAENQDLEAQLAAARAEIEAMRSMTTPRTRSKLDDAKKTDSGVGLLKRFMK